jgi:hypothetical protein
MRNCMQTSADSFELSKVRHDSAKLFLPDKTKYLTLSSYFCNYELTSALYHLNNEAKKEDTAYL